MYDYLFEHGEAVTDDSLRQSAKSSVKSHRFNREFLESTYSSHIDEDIQSANSSGVKRFTLLSLLGQMFVIVNGIKTAF